MKIGFSLGRCVRDIVLGKVDIKDVVVIVAQTRCENRRDLFEVIDGYMYRTNYLRGLDAAQCNMVASELWETCKLHQPRLLGAHPQLIVEQAVWKDVVDSE